MRLTFSAEEYEYNLLKDIRFRHTETMSTRTCIACGQTQFLKNYRTNQKACISCEEDKTVYFEKTCTKCGESKDRLLFTKNLRSCKDCNGKAVANKVCEGCHEMKYKTEYRRGQPICKMCEGNGVEYTKTCKDCGQDKSSSLFRTNRRQCIDCERGVGRDYRRTTTKAQEWTENNKEKMATLQKDWYEKNKKKIREKESTRLREDETLRKIKGYRNCMGRVIRGVNQSNKMLVCTRKEFINWLSFSFVENMTTDSYNEVWNVDHVIPLDVLLGNNKNEWCLKIINKYDSQNCLFSWCNTQPLYKGDNRLKSNKITYEMLSDHLKKLNSYAKKYNKKDETYLAYKKIITKIMDTLYGYESKK